MTELTENLRVATLIAGPNARKLYLDAADEIDRLRGVILNASTIAGMGRRREACELLHREVYPDDKTERD